jgi:hypothetical protein
LRWSADANLTRFEAAWSGDLDKIRTLTTTSWHASGEEPPLKLAVSDDKSANPFSLAFLRGHFHVARAILDIVQAQWTPKEKENARYKMERGDGEGSYESEEDDDPKVYKETINELLPIDNIGQVSMQVKSDVLAGQILGWNCRTFKNVDGDFENTGADSLIAFCIEYNDMERFKHLVNWGIHFAKQRTDEDEGDSDKSYVLPNHIFDKLIQMGRLEMLADVIKRTGAGMPIQDFVDKSGVEMKVKPRYYQGLTVYGKKRKDWANAGRNLMVRATGNKMPPLLLAALRGSLESVEWFLSDAPTRQYLDFGSSRTAKEDPRLKHLHNLPGGFDRTILKWLGLQSQYSHKPALCCSLYSNTFNRR